MAIKVCPICGKEYDDEINESCPLCSEQTEKEDVQEALQEEIENAEAVCEDALISGETDEEIVEESGNKTLKIVAAALGAVLVILAAFFIYAKIATPKEKNYLAAMINSEVSDGIDNADKFTAKDLDGTFSDDKNHVYYTFSQGKASIEVPTATEEVTDPAADSSVDSSAEPKTKVVASQTVEYDGTYSSGMTQKGIRQMVIIDYIEENGLAQAYMDYIEEKDILSSDFEGFIKEKKLEASVSTYDSENGLSQKYAFDKLEGYWNYSDGVISLYDNSGESAGEYKVTDKGIINTAYLYEGKLPSKNDLCTIYKMQMENYGTSQEISIRLYRDGYCILEVEGDSGSYQAGTYEADDDGVYISINGQTIFFYVTDMGICNEILTK